MAEGGEGMTLVKEPWWWTAVTTNHKKSPNLELKTWTITNKIEIKAQKDTLLLVADNIDRFSSSQIERERGQFVAANEISMLVAGAVLSFVRVNPYADDKSPV